MIALIDIATGKVVRVTPSIDGIDMTGLEAGTPPEGFDPLWPNYIWAAGEWVFDLVPAKAQRRAAVTARRNQAESGGCATPLGRVNTDDVSKLRISGAVQLALIAQASSAPFAIDWTMEDNSTLAHDASAMIAMGVAVGTHVALCHANSQALKAAIEAASDLAAIEAIDIEAGWP